MSARVAGWRLMDGLWGRTDLHKDVGSVCCVLEMATWSLPRLMFCVGILYCSCAFPVLALELFYRSPYFFLYLPCVVLMVLL